MFTNSDNLLKCSHILSSHRTKQYPHISREMFLYYVLSFSKSEEVGPKTYFLFRSINLLKYFLFKYIQYFIPSLFIFVIFRFVINHWICSKAGHNSAHCKSVDIAHIFQSTVPVIHFLALIFFYHHLPIRKG